jgi:LacI family transcriptional regulator
MQEVADQLGLHRSTVSLALRDHPSIPEETRARVRAAAGQMGYQLNPLVAALMSFRRSTRHAPPRTTLACISSSSPPDAWKESLTMREMLAGARERAQAQGYNIEEFPFYARGMTPERFHQVLTARGIVGLIIAPLRNDRDSLPIAWEQFATVAMGFTLRSPAITRIGNDHGQSMRLVIAECRDRGYRRLGLVLERFILERVEDQWLAGFLIEHAHPKRRPYPAPLIVNELKEKSFLDWYGSAHPDVILTGGGATSGRVLSWLKRAGIPVPGDVGVISLDLHVRDGTIAGIDQNPTEIGATVVDHLIGQLHRNERGPAAATVRVHVMGEWIEGQTLRSRPAP